MSGTEPIQGNDILTCLDKCVDEHPLLRQAANAIREMREQKKRSGMDAVLQMRDEFLQFVAAYNKVGDYRSAMDAQVMSIALHKFEEDHGITTVLWPPNVIYDSKHGFYIEGIDDE